jgi:hypothetical protein
MNDAADHYRVELTDGRYRLLDASGDAVLECTDESSAHHYADLLNKAYRRGYRQGNRDARARGNVR